jgi:hypothetical protein
LCILTDNRFPIPYREGDEDIPIHSIQELKETLRFFSFQEPGVLILSSQHIPTLFIGIAGELAAVTAYPEPPTRLHCSWSAMSETPYTTENLGVPSEGETSLFKARCVMPIEDVICIVAYIVEHGELPNTISWVQNPEDGSR